MNMAADNSTRNANFDATAYWVSRDTIVWEVAASPNYSYHLHYDPACSLQLVNDRDIAGGQALPLTFVSYGPGKDLLDKFPHLSGRATFKLRPEAGEIVPQVLKSQIVVTAHDQAGYLVDAAGLQIPGVLDDLYTYKGPLGVAFEDD